eukprot:gnl/MRDRNA2_/MRDRNA2_95692_c0_seq1.p1 gnl/MRDRNA2_/MRDRNA2_95692_c0~~gnl/MRDRNA2_/MRDRNA2_95692_c0_seq1.p1  ORF type:complete len:216 (-),score=41.69 gnl/MRDRNA2_/MRDRNA2_95692_c0_seq1:43-639(-)
MIDEGDSDAIPRAEAAKSHRDGGFCGGFRPRVEQETMWSSLRDSLESTHQGWYTKRIAAEQAVVRARSVKGVVDAANHRKLTEDTYAHKMRESARDRDLMTSHVNFDAVRAERNGKFQQIQSKAHQDIHKQREAHRVQADVLRKRHEKNHNKLVAEAARKHNEIVTAGKLAMDNIQKQCRQRSGGLGHHQHNLPGHPQ